MWDLKARELNTLCASPRRIMGVHFSLQARHRIGGLEKNSCDSDGTQCKRGVGAGAGACL